MNRPVWCSFEHVPNEAGCTDYFVLGYYGCCASCNRNKLNDVDRLESQLSESKKEIERFKDIGKRILEAHKLSEVDWEAMRELEQALT